MALFQSHQHVSAHFVTTKDVQMCDCSRAFVTSVPHCQLIQACVCVGMGVFMCVWACVCVSRTLTDAQCSERGIWGYDSTWHPQSLIQTRLLVLSLFACGCFDIKSLRHIVTIPEFLQTLSSVVLKRSAPSDMADK